MSRKHLSVVIVCILIFAFSAAPSFALGENVNPDSIPFAPPVWYDAGSLPASVFCADLDGDDDMDLAVANYVSGTVSVLKNNGDGTFQTKVDYSVGYEPHSVFCADLDGDHDLDLAVASGSSVSILKNDGDGAFQTKVDYDPGGYSVFCADLDGDSDLDLAVANGSGVSILENNGDGTFQTSVDYSTGGLTWSVFSADLDGDGDSDIAVVNYWNDNLSILKNNGDASFQAKVDYGVGTRPMSVFCADLDGDDDLDLAVANMGWDVSILKNNGDGTFQPKIDYGWLPYASSALCADLDGDADLDLAVGKAYQCGFSILKNDGAGLFQTQIDYNVGGDMDSSLFCADLDGDGDLDIAQAYNASPSGVSVWINLTQAAGNSPPYSFPLLSPENAGVVCDSMTGTGDSVANFDWAAALDPNLSDQVTYDLYISTSDEFPPGPETIIDSNLTVRQQFRALPLDCYFWKVKAKDSWGAERWSTQTRHFMVGCGDLNNNCHADIGDLVYLVNYLYKQGPQPVPMEAGDVNEDGILNIADVIYLISYLYRSGSPPCSPP
ncbi:MAG: VCBS repeat-containing protein [Candidatus Zixiibacteriota bacterium]|nr:MAG: VCBS repeat-containing protein [candidate division Zixibacteria bacterium]